MPYFNDSNNKKHYIPSPSISIGDGEWRTMRKNCIDSKEKAKAKIIEYFKNNIIEYRFLNEEERPLKIDSSDTLYLCTRLPDIVIGGKIETTIRFKKEHLYCQSYYCQPIVYTEEEAIRGARIVNYLNMHLEYDCDTLFDHSFILDEENGDIFNGCLIRYELLDEFFSEAMNHILNYSVKQISDVCKAIVFYIHGDLDYFQATKILIDHELMEKKYLA